MCFKVNDNCSCISMFNVLIILPMGTVFVALVILAIANLRCSRSWCWWFVLYPASSLEQSTYFASILYAILKQRSSTFCYSELEISFYALLIELQLAIIKFVVFRKLKIIRKTFSFVLCKLPSSSSFLFCFHVNILR
jgi:hypothetical protein